MEMAVQAPTSHGVHWDHSQEEFFNWVGRNYDIRKAKRILAEAPREIHQIGIEGLRDLIARSEPGEYGKTILHVGIAVREEDLTAPVDLEVPLILAFGALEGQPDMPFPIDGWHRIKAALDRGVFVLPGVVLELAETETIRC